MNEKNVNKNYKDSVFTAIFSDKKKLIGLYNALSGSNYAPDTQIVVNTLSDVLFFDRKNDLSFIIDGKLVVLIEQQSTINANMPLRFLLYLSRILENYIAQDSTRIYSTRRIQFPKPEFICLYNGVDTLAQQSEYRLSESFFINMPLTNSIDLTVKVLNINEGYNKNIVEKSQDLYGYVSFVSKTRSFVNSGIKLEEAIEMAIIYCMNHNILEDFLRKYGKEVASMLTKEFDLQKAQKAWFNDGKLEGREEGKQEGKQEGKEEGKEEGKLEGKQEAQVEMALKLLKRNMSATEIADVTSLSLSKINQIKKEINNA